MRSDSSNGYVTTVSGINTINAFIDKNTHYCEPCVLRLKKQFGLQDDVKFEEERHKPWWKMIKRAKCPWCIIDLSAEQTMDLKVGTSPDGNDVQHTLNLPDDRSSDEWREVVENVKKYLRDSDKDTLSDKDRTQSKLLIDSIESHLPAFLETLKVTTINLNGIGAEQTITVTGFGKVSRLHQSTIIELYMTNIEQQNKDSLNTLMSNVLHDIRVQVNKRVQEVIRGTIESNKVEIIILGSGILVLVILNLVLRFK